MFSNDYNVILKFHTGELSVVYYIDGNNECMFFSFLDVMHVQEILDVTNF